jgi:hypothetical protein
MRVQKSVETKAKLAASMIGNSNSSNQPNAVKIEVLDLETNLTTTYDTIGEAARALNISQSSISYNLKSKKQKPYKGRYVFSKL